MVRDHQNNQHMSRLEWIVIWLIVAAVSDTRRCAHDRLAAFVLRMHSCLLAGGKYVCSVLVMPCYALLCLVIPEVDNHLAHHGGR
jgi:hypothetical protein